MAQKEVHTVPTERGWANRAGSYAISKHRKKANAQKAGRKQAIERKARHTIHRKDRTVAETHSYA